MSKPNKERQWKRDTTKSTSRKKVKRKTNKIDRREARKTNGKDI